MNFQISRSGQLYGPYTLDDLRRYLVSGNVLPSDLAKSDEMADWLPVSQILAGSSAGAAGAGAGSAGAGAAWAGAAWAGAAGAEAATAPSAGAYPGSSGAPYEAGYGTTFNPAEGFVGPLNPILAASTYPDPPSLHWALVALFSLFTCGLFMFIWNLLVAVWLKRVQPNATALLYYIAAGVCIVLACIFPGVAVHRVFGPGLHHSSNPMAGLLLLAFWGLKIAARFLEQASLEEHFNGLEPIGLRLNPVMTFFFGGLYFQHHLTRIAALKQAARFVQPAANLY